MKINHISISREQCYRECPIKYRFRYHLEVKPDGPEPIYFVFGKIVHKIIEEHTKCKGTKDIGEIATDVLAKSPPLEPDYKQKLYRHIDHYKRFAEKIGYDGEIEWKFTIDMDGKGRNMTGFIDRMINKDGNVSLIDFKTTKPSMWRTDSRKITRDLQLQCYCYVAWKKFDVDPRNIQAALLFLDDNKLVPVRFAEKTLATVPERLLSVFKEIEELPAEKAYPNIGQHCKRCDYMRQCPFYNHL